MSPKSRAGASKDEPQSSKKRASTTKAGAAAGKGRAVAGKGEPDGAQAGETGAPAGTSNATESSGQAGERIRTLDFSQPTKFTTEIRRRIVGRDRAVLRGAVGPPHKRAVRRKSSSASPRSTSTPGRPPRRDWPRTRSRSLSRQKAIERQMLLSVEQPLLLQALECLLGGQAAQAPSERHLTDIDWMLAAACSRGSSPSCRPPGASSAAPS